MGNKTKYSKAVVDRICRFISSGLNNKQAAAAAGISETSLLVWRKQHPDFAEQVEAAREIMRSKILAKIKAAGKDDWRALECFLRLSFAEYRFTNANQVNIAVSQQSLSITDPERADLIERRERALATKEGASEPKQLDASNAREIALEAESKLAKGVSVEVHDPAR